MIKIKLKETESFDRVSSTFIINKAYTLRLEHSLASISKWESKWCKPFIGKDEKTTEEIYSYILCMSLDDDIDEEDIKRLTQKEINAITEYINSPMTATTISKTNNKPSREIITAEVLYFKMVSLNIPFECQHWHLNKLITLINVCDAKNGPQKKQSIKETMRQNTSLNAMRKKAMQTSG